jgi:phosphoribosylaminoimidazole carboxylase, catalytic subunit
MAAALAGVVAGHTTLPVIGVPLKSNVLEGVDALLSTVMMPSGIPVATVAIDGSKNAAYLAAQILAISDDELAKKVLENRQKQSAAVLVKDQEIQEKVQAL